MKHHRFGALALCLALSACNRHQQHVVYEGASAQGDEGIANAYSGSVYSEAEIGARAREPLPSHREQREIASSSGPVINTGRDVSTTAASSYGNPPGAYTGPGTTRAVRPSQGASRDDLMANENVTNESPIGGSASGMAQGTSQADRLATQRIRRAIMNDASLSYTAKNVEVITNDGNIALRGQVLSDKERWQIERIARGYAGSGKVDNLLDIKLQPVP